MDNIQKQTICIRELLFHEGFLEKYKTQLSALFEDSTFLHEVAQAAQGIPEEIIFSSVSDSSAFMEFKRSTINQYFFSAKLYYNYPDYRDIVDSVSAGGNTKLSATISTYYAIQYLLLSSVENTSSEDSSPEKPTANPLPSDEDYRQKYPAKFRCDDGHYVRSKNEQLVDNWLYHNNCCHAYEKLVIDQRNSREYISDFYIPISDTYIEVWGLDTAEYLARKENKIEVYASNGLQLLQMTEKAIHNLDDFMRRNLPQKSVCVK